MAIPDFQTLMLPALRASSATRSPLVAMRVRALAAADDRKLEAAE